VKRTPILLLAILSFSAVLRAQNVESGEFFFDAIPFQGNSPDSTRLDMMLSIPYGSIGFERQKGIYVGKYKAHFKVTSGSRPLYDSTFIRTVETSSYDVSTGITPAYEFYQQRVTLPPGTYATSVELLDMRSSTAATAQRTVTAIDYRNRPLELSGLMLVGKIREDSTGFIITPMVTDNVSVQEDGYFLFFEVYNSTQGRRFRIATTYRLVGKKENIPGPLFDREFPPGRSQQWVRLPGGGLARGAHTVELQVSSVDDTSNVLARAERIIRFGETLDGIPASEEDLAEKISQLRYVAGQSDIDDIRDAGAFAEKRKRYAEFWTKLDPTPGTARNEAMEEYFRRIEYANDNFRSYAAGWLTDKGRVFVIYGPPDNTSSDPFRSEGKAVETWQYYHRSLRVVFVDESGFGDFRLTTPLPLGDKYRYSE
jgi:GWxTD domain-containing protein